MPKKPGLTTIKTLFARSCNRCAFPNCDLSLTSPEWKSVRADIAHIRGEKPSAARYAPEMTDDERASIDNLLLLCPNHHREIDRLRPEDWPAERLMELKVAHEARCENPHWTDDGHLEFYASLLYQLGGGDEDAAADEEPAARPRLEVRRGEKDTFDVWNVGLDDAFEVRPMKSPHSTDNGFLRIEDVVLPRLSPGGKFFAGLALRAFGDTGRAIVRVTWQDADGREFDGDFPVD